MKKLIGPGELRRSREFQGPARKLVPRGLGKIKVGYH